MKLKDLTSNVHIVETKAKLDLDIRDICHDSRLVQPGDLFVAISGFATDGHQYIASAVGKGAVCVVCQQVPQEDVPYILVEDSRLALAQISAKYFGEPSKQMKMVGVTGTNGKTTSTILLKQVLEACLDAKVGLIGTNEILIGQKVIPAERTTPESYALQKLLRQMCDAGCTHVVMEVSSHALVLHRVAEIVYDVAVFTNLSQDHLDFHKTMDAYAHAKAALFAQSKVGIINADDEYASIMYRRAQESGCKVLRFSLEKNEADFMAKNAKLRADAVQFSILIPGEIQRVSLPIPGAFSIYNALGVFGAASVLGVGLESAAQALSKAKGVPGRVELVPTDGDYTILIDYAHTPDALENVLVAVRSFAQGRVVTLFGCGGDRDRTKRPQMGEIAGRLSDFVIVTSDNPRTEEPMAIIADIAAGLGGKKAPYEVIEDRRAAIAFAIDHHQPGDLILLAGKGHETYQEIGKEKYPLDEREVVASHIAKTKGVAQ